MRETLIDPPPGNFGGPCHHFTYDFVALVSLHVELKSLTWPALCHFLDHVETADLTKFLTSSITVVHEVQKDNGTVLLLDGFQWLELNRQTLKTHSRMCSATQRDLFP